MPVLPLWALKKMHAMCAPPPPNPPNIVCPFANYCPTLVHDETPLWSMVANVFQMFGLEFYWAYFPLSFFSCYASWSDWWRFWYLVGSSLACGTSLLGCLLASTLSPCPLFPFLSLSLGAFFLWSLAQFHHFQMSKRCMFSEVFDHQIQKI
jgi:hypothetical protein